jgi:spermidine synthase
MKKTLLIGGGTFGYPRHFLRSFPEAEMDVVEIDPGLVHIARSHFFLEDDPRLAIHIEDGRTYLNRCRTSYDVIFGDAFKSYYSIPFQLSTLEAIQKKYDLLNDGGLVVLNLISALEGRKSQFLKAELATYRKVFPQVLIFPVMSALHKEEVQNIILVAFKSEVGALLISDDQQTASLLERRFDVPLPDGQIILTDDFAPVERYTNELM